MDKQKQSIYKLMEALKSTDKDIFKYLCKLNEIVEKDGQFLIWSWNSIYTPLTSEEFGEFLSEFNAETRGEE